MRPQRPHISPSTISYLKAITMKTIKIKTITLVTLIHSSAYSMPGNLLNVLCT